MRFFTTYRKPGSGQIPNRLMVTEENGFTEASLWGTKMGTLLVVGEIPSPPSMTQVMKAVLA